jgi:phospholysine phosphohistidine inorganic pyrophosphate phosphatase
VKTFRSVLIDIDGVLSLADSPIPGSIEAVSMLRRHGAGIRLITNTTRKTRSEIVHRLRTLGFDIETHEVITGALAARRILLTRGLRPYLLIHPGLLPDFSGIATENPNAVVVGDAADGFSYQALNAAFRILVEQQDAPLIALANNRYFRAADGLCLDAGPYVAALEYASKTRAQVTGKPAEAIFRTALDELASAPGDAMMIGDDIEGDIGGARALGLRTVLVRTGKYRESDENHPLIRPDAVADDFYRAVVDFVCPCLVGPASGDGAAVSN